MSACYVAHKIILTALLRDKHRHFVQRPSVVVTLIHVTAVSEEAPCIPGIYQLERLTYFRTLQGGCLAT